MFDFSMEDMTFADNKHKLNKKSIEVFDGFADCVAPLFEPNTGVEAFSMEASRLLADSDRFGFYASGCMEMMKREFSVIKSIRDKYGIEKLDPETFGTENKFTDGAKKVWGAIVNAFRTLIQAVSNFIKSVMNFIGSAFAKGQSKYYEQYTTAGSNFNDQVKMKKGFSGKFNGDMLDRLLNAEVLGSKALEPIMGNASRLFVAESGPIRTVAKMGPEPTDVDEKAGELNTKDLGIIKHQIDAFWKAMSLGEKLSNNYKAADYVRLNIWSQLEASPTKGETTNGAIIENLIPIKLLSQDSLNKMNTGVKAGKAAIKEFSKAVKVAEKAAGKNSPAKIMGEVRYVCSFLTGVLLTTFSEFLKARSILAQAVKLGLKKRNS